jgi:hypothetical protein
MTHSNNDDRSQDKDQFLYPTSSYCGEFTPENLVFNANLQEFAQRASFVCGLESNGKLTPQEAYEEIKKLYKELKASKKELKIGENPPTKDS